MDRQLYADIVQRLNDDGVDNQAQELVLHALEADQPQTEPHKPTFIRSLTVEGFRGIGPPATLELDPHPGLTLVVGRNGSGKSSFAEALELLFTGDSYRWARRSKVWREGWRNLHHPSAKITVELVVEGEGARKLERAWSDDAELDDASTKIVRAGQKSKAYEPDATHRPFLSYSELGSMLDEGPSKLYDALATILGLHDLVEAQESIRQTRLERERTVKAAKQDLVPLLDQLRACDDERARKAEQALAQEPWDLEALDASSADEPADLATLRALATLEAPDPRATNEAALRIREASGRAQQLEGTDAGQARATAQLLAQALAMHTDGDCPVCGTKGVLHERWRTDTEEEVQRLRALAQEAEDAHAELSGAVDMGRGLTSAVPSVLDGASGLGLDTADAVRTWKDWSSAPSEPEELAVHLSTKAAPVAEAVSALKTQASSALDALEDTWRPVARQLSHWAVSAAAADAAAASLPPLKQAESWLKETFATIRDSRFSPIASEAQEIWKLLRMQSNVDLGGIELAGAGSQRRVTLDVTVDGADGSALGVMSQGELNSLALALFLPRATLDSSPFRFVVIDDPVQSMDPAKVDGLARALQRQAADRQVIVFTHDARLPDAVRRMRIESNVVEVTRSSGSVVSLRPVLDSVTRYLYDVRTLLNTTDLPPKVASRVVPGLCRLALEAACTEAVLRRRLGRGDAHAEVTDALTTADTLMEKGALAIFDDASRTGEVYRWLSGNVGASAPDTFKLVNKGAHSGTDVPLERLLADTQAVARKLERVT